ncbi:MAG: tRNA1(Val) (adenine(37)-N6)-methyltransferase [Pseudorhodoplanes sp.]|uniref:tRNA1(Val) (adenine(37)-N6)-methyltransferase n=1 Tax=Pseudorhodoplanes sp. TaxID=1934341 RepID=UPI003D0CC3D8
MTRTGETVSDLTCDAILNGRLRLVQPRRGHRFGHDAILLAAAVPANSGQHVAEFGAGVGAASLALLSRVPALDATLFEIDPALCELADRNIARNGFAAQARTIRHDVAAPFAGRRFDHVFMNPPFNDSTLQASPDPGRRTAHDAPPDLLVRWLGGASRMLRDGGTVTLIWRAAGLSHVLHALEDEFGAISVLPIYPAPDRPAIRLIAAAAKGGGAPLQILPGLTLNDEARQPSGRAEAILRQGAPLPLAAAAL